MDELKHYGVLGMKWGVRKDRTSPSFGERRQVRKLKGAYKSSVKGVVRRTRMADDDRKALATAEDIYEKTQKRGQGLTKKTREKRDADVQNAELVVQKRMKSLKDAEEKQNRSLMIMDDRAKDLTNYVKSLNEKYGKENVKQLETRKRDINAGKDFVLQNVFKTGLRVQDLPFIGSRITGKQLSNWEREYRYNKLDNEQDEEMIKYRR